MNGTMQIFLSYARSDGLDIADRLRADLAEADLPTWLDREKILAGGLFTQDLANGIQACELMIAVLTPSSVRVASDPANATQTDSVCLNEIHEARFYAHRPILPVMALPCKPPFDINNLDYVDITRRDDGNAYCDGLKRILDRIRAVQAGGSIPIRSRPAVVAALDDTFELFLGQVRDGFRGRDWAFSLLNDWLQDPSGLSLLLITGDPGSGKSALASELVRRNTDGQVFAYHVCRADRPITLEPASFVASISDMIATRIDGYRAALDYPHLQDLIANDPVSAFPIAVLNPLKSLPSRQPCYLLVDALDEALCRTEPANIVKLLVASRPFLPPWLRIVMTSRPGPAVKTMRAELPYEITFSCEKNRSDVRDYIDFRIGQPAFARKLADAGKTPAEVIAWVRSIDESNPESNFLFVKLVLNEIEACPASHWNQSWMPLKLGELYALWFQRFYPEPNSAQCLSIRRLLGIVATAKASLTRAQLAQVAGPDCGLIQDMLRNLSSFVSEQNGWLRLFHKTFGEWLVADSKDYRIDSDAANRSLAEACWQQYLKVAEIPEASRLPVAAPTSFRIYAQRHGIQHLLDAGRYADAVDMLAFLFVHQKEMECDIELYLGRYAKQVSLGLKSCEPAEARKINPRKLASLLRRFYEIEPVSSGIRLLRAYRTPDWESILNDLLADDDFVIRFAVAEALAEREIAVRDSECQYIFRLAADPEVNRSEVGGYALKLVYSKTPQRIDAALLGHLAESETYSGRLILGDLLLNLAFCGKDRSALVTADRFWNPVWDVNKLDIVKLRACNALIGGALPASAAPEVIETYTALKQFDEQRVKLLADPALPAAIRAVLNKYRSLGIDKDVIRDAQGDLETSPALLQIMRLLFAHPLWDVAEAAASVLSSIDRDTAAPIIDSLLSDPQWDVRYGAIEAAFGFRYVDDYKLFTRAVHDRYNDPNCLIRALCAENFTAWVLDTDGDERERLCKDFAPQIKAWLKDEDCWVLEHVYRLIRQLDRKDFDCTDLLADGASRLFAGNAAWYRAERGDYLKSIEAAKRHLMTFSAAQ